MNYGQLIGQAWQVIKKTKLLQLFILLFCMSFIPLYKTGSSVLNCIWLFLLLITYIIVLPLSMIGVTLSAESTLQGKPITFKEIWLEFRANFLRYYALIVIIGILPVTFLFFSNRVLNGSFTTSNWMTLFLNNLINLFTNGITYFGLFSLLIPKMDVSTSISYGFKVFFKNWFKVIMLVFITRIPIVVFDLISVGIISKGTFPYSAYSQIHSNYLVQLSTNVLNAVGTTFAIVMLLLAYHQFIPEFDYPTLKEAQA
jgi:hypothetical protein